MNDIKRIDSESLEELVDVFYTMIPSCLKSTAFKENDYKEIIETKYFGTYEYLVEDSVGNKYAVLVCCKYNNEDVYFAPCYFDGKWEDIQKEFNSFCKETNYIPILAHLEAVSDDFLQSIDNFIGPYNFARYKGDFFQEVTFEPTGNKIRILKPILERLDIKSL